MWHVSSRSGVATLRTAMHLLLTRESMGMGTRMCLNWNVSGKSTRDNRNGSGYFFMCAKIPIGRLNANAIQLNVVASHLFFYINVLRCDNLTITDKMRF